MAHLRYHSKHCLVLLRTPDFLTLPQSADPPESVQTLILVPVFHMLGDDIPLLGVLIIEHDEFLILLNCPCFNKSLFEESTLGCDL